MIEFKKVGGKEKKFLKEERKAIWPELKEKEFRKWREGKDEPYAPIYWALVKDGEIIGGTVVEIQDFLNETRIVLELDAIWIKEEFRKKGYGKKLLKNTFRESQNYYQGYKLYPVGIIIQTTSLDVGAIEFYQKSIDLPYSIATQEMSGVQIAVFIVSFPRDGEN